MVSKNVLVTGGLARCVVCGRTLQIQRHVSSNWRAVTLDGRPIYYACPAEFPPDTASSDQFEAAYLRVLARALEAPN